MSGLGSGSGSQKGEQKRPREEVEPSGGRKGNKKLKGPQQYGPQCSTSGKFHGNKPYFKTSSGCHKCGAPDHWVGDCPKRGMTEECWEGLTQEDLVGSCLCAS